MAILTWLPLRLAAACGFQTVNEVACEVGKLCTSLSSGNLRVHSSLWIGDVGRGFCPYGPTAVYERFILVWCRKLRTRGKIKAKPELVKSSTS